MKHLLTFLVPAMLMIVPGSLGSARAATGDFRVNLEPGVASLQNPLEPRAWGLLGALSASVGIGDLLAIQFHGDRKVFLGQKPQLTVMAWGLAVVHNFDILWLTPLLELGLAGVSQSGPQAVRSKPEIVPILGVGIDWRVSPWVVAGIVFRYYPLLNTDLLAPAYGAVNARIGVIFGGGG